MMEIGFVTDEISPDPAEAIRIGSSWGIRSYELRCIGANRVPHIPKEDVSVLMHLMREYPVRITALSPGTFKTPLNGKSELRKELSEVLPRTFEMAHSLGTSMVIVFGFQKTGEEGPEMRGDVVDLFMKAAEAARRSDIVLAVENEPGFWCDTGERTAAIIADVGSPNFKANWDPANAVGTDEVPFPDGYSALKPYIVNVHVKDTDSHALSRCVPVGKGLVDWEGQIGALVRDKTVGHVTIETHVLPLVENSWENLNMVRSYLSNVQS